MCSLQHVYMCSLQQCTYLYICTCFSRIVLRPRPEAQNVFSPAFVLFRMCSRIAGGVDHMRGKRRMCSLQTVFSLECVLVSMCSLVDGMCSLQNRMCSRQHRMCSLSIECVLFLQNVFLIAQNVFSRGWNGAGRAKYVRYTQVAQNVFSYYRMCSLAIECVVLLPGLHLGIS